MALAGIVVLRACGYEFGVVGNYAAYFALYVVLPGVVAMHWVNRGPLSLTNAIALGIPMGFALEIGAFLGLSAAGLREYYAWVPVAWVALLLTCRVRARDWPVRLRLSARHAGLGLGLAVVFLGTALMAASQMFSESPLADGLPARAIFHDWVYLVSRAGVIKNHWPLDDPSLAGTPLQYHYFMMVHAAAASWTTGVELTLVMLRLIFIPLGAILVVQAYALGRRVSRNPWGGVVAAVNPWGGVVAAVLAIMASEVSFASNYGQPMFLGLFVRWLFVSPTFFFGMIYCGALLLAVAQCARLQRCGARHYLWLLLLAAAGTGAKGTVLPVLVCAMGLWVVWKWIHERRPPMRLISFGACLTVGFVTVYYVTMSAWRTGDAGLNPFHVFELTAFWRHYLPRWEQWLGEWLPPFMAEPVASVACGVVVFAGSCGVRLLAIPYLFSQQARRRGPWVPWLSACFIASAGMGLLMELNSYGELYVILMMRLPMAALAAAFLVLAVQRLRPWLTELRPCRQPVAVPGAVSGVAAPSSFYRVAIVGGLVVLAVAMTIQTRLWWARNRPGLGEWLSTPAAPRADDYMRELHEALRWVRHNTEADAVLIPNAYTPENMKGDHWGALDRTLMGVHFYYSALSERRLWFEGPNYILDTTRARRRCSLASGFFYRGTPLPPELVSNGPSYALIDRTLADGATVKHPGHRRVFANSRIEIYRLPYVADPRTAGD
jgi:hypothetical protein